MTKQELDMLMAESAQGDRIAKARLERLGYKLKLIPSADVSGALLVVVYDLREMIDDTQARRDAEHITGDMPF